jgi:hypothetical protein
MLIVAFVGMMPEDSVYGVWPRSGEIDIMESRGNGYDYSAGGRDYYYGALHWGKETHKYIFHDPVCVQFLTLQQGLQARQMPTGGPQVPRLSSVATSHSNSIPSV